MSDQFGRVAPYNVWTDATPSLDDFRGVKEANFGTSAERAGTSGMPGMTAAAWTQYRQDTEALCISLWTVDNILWWDVHIFWAIFRTR